MAQRSGVQREQGEPCFAKKRAIAGAAAHILGFGYVDQVRIERRGLQNPALLFPTQSLIVEHCGWLREILSRIHDHISDVNVGTKSHYGHSS
jgi:hypothetical protein